MRLLGLYVETMKVLAAAECIAIPTLAGREFARSLHGFFIKALQRDARLWSTR